MNTVENTCRTGISGYAQPKSPESLTVSKLGQEFTKEIQHSARGHVSLNHEIC